jgi:hypothetical protein
MKATHRLIDSVWTLEYELDEAGNITILKYSRSDQEGYDKEKELPQCTVVENTERTVLAVYIRDSYEPFGWVNANNCDRVYVVSNPKHIFDYGA